MKPYLLHIHERPLTLVKFNYDGDFFITCAKDGDVALIRTESCERVGTYAPQGDKSGAIFAVDITHDSTYVVTAGADGKLVFYTFEGEQVKSLNHGGILKYVEFNQKPGDQTKVVTCNDKFKSTTEGSVGNRIMVWQADFEAAQPLKRLLTIENDLPMKATKVKWGPFDKTLVSIFEEGTIYIFDAVDGSLIDKITHSFSPVTSVNFSEDRMLMVTSSKDMTAKLWAMDNYECVKTYKSDRPLNDVVISPMFNSDKEKKPHLLMGGGQDAKDVTTTASSDGKFQACLWHMIYEEEIGTVKGHFGPINSLAWFRDGRGFVTGGEDGYVRVHFFDADYFTSDRFE
jgi:translation initiation factor 3 subunit I